MIKRRDFLLQVAMAATATACAPVANQFFPGTFGEVAEKQRSQKTGKVVKAFCIDFNWAPDLSGPAKPGTFTQADPRAHVDWYKNLGVNTIQTFCVSYNGHAWYSDSAVAPVNPGLEKRNFLAQMCKYGHDAGMQVMGYFTFGSNPVWETKYPDLSKKEKGKFIRIPATLEWLDYFSRQIEDALQKNDIDGFMVDWLLPTPHQVWIDAEKRMWRELMGEPFPVSGVPSPEGVIEFDKRAMERAWRHIKWVTNATRKVKIWPNQPFSQREKAVWEGHRVFKEADWILNEYPDLSRLDWLKKQIGKDTLVLQNLCGWPTHDASAWKKVDISQFGLYGYAQADANTTFPLDSFQKNIDIIREAYRLT